MRKRSSTDLLLAREERRVGHSSWAGERKHNYAWLYSSQVQLAKSRMLACSTLDKGIKGRFFVLEKMELGDGHFGNNSIVLRSNSAKVPRPL